MDLQPTIGHRHFRAGGDIAAERMHRREALENALGRLAVIGLRGDGVENRELLGLEQLATELKRALPGGMRQLINEALDVDGVVVGVDAAPEARREMRVAHRMVDENVRYVVTERALGA